MARAGLVVSAGDPVALLDAVLYLRSDPEVAARYGANGRRHREAVLGENVAMERWGNLLRDAITSRT